MMINENFTIKDIHKIRYENYENTKHLSQNELIEVTNRKAAKILLRLEEIKNIKLKKTKGIF